jgi:hypothetical protein
MQNPSEFSDDVIRRFLLGNLRDDERPAFEARLFEDDELETRVRLAELDLADEYALARLTAADREQFQRNFLVTENRRAAVKVSKALHDRLASSHNLGFAARIASFIDFRQPAWKYALAAFLIIILIATAWLVTKEPQIVAPFLPKRALPKSSATATPQEANHSSSTSAPPHHAEPSPALPMHELPATTVVIEPNNTIERAPTVKLLQGDRDLVRLQLVLEKNPSRTYQAEIVSLGGKAVFRVESLTPDDLRVNVEIPARLLSAGDYEVKLSRIHGRSKQRVANYYFRVQ